MRLPCGPVSGMRGLACWQEIGLSEVLVGALLKSQGDRTSHLRRFLLRISLVAVWGVFCHLLRESDECWQGERTQCAIDPLRWWTEARGHRPLQALLQGVEAMQRQRAPFLIKEDRGMASGRERLRRKTFPHKGRPLDRCVRPPRTLLHPVAPISVGSLSRRGRMRARPGRWRKWPGKRWTAQTR